MRFLDQVSDKSLKNIILYLTQSEATELRDSLNDLLENPLNNHAHITSEDSKNELTVCIYNIENLQSFNERSIELILKDI